MVPRQHRHPSTARPPAAAAFWGDGFAEDGLYDFWAVRDWSLCSPDEYILAFPRLIPRPGEFPPVLQAHLEACITARAWRLASIDSGGVAPRLHSRLPDLESGAARQRDWFVDDDAVTGLLRRVGLLRTKPERVEAERDHLLFLDRMLADVQLNRWPAWSEISEALLAFAAGIHPVYVWPQATLCPTRGIVAGWLGHLDRGRTALMPMVVAEYVLDALDGEVPGDRQLVALVGVANLDLLRRAARRRWSGQDTAVRLAPDAASLARVLSAKGRALPTMDLSA